MPEWIHNRAEHLLAKNPSMPKSTAFALATQQSHKMGKTPKGYGTAEGKREARAKYDKPKKDYVKGANPGNLETPKLSDKPKTKWTGKHLVRKEASVKIASMRDELIQITLTKLGKDQLPGGLADKMTDADFDKKQLQMGEKVELEHTDDKAKAREISRDHLEEIPDYYTRLKKMEDQAERAKGD
jgi:hypothetical protein